jgi:hypothetical protein
VYYADSAVECQCVWAPVDQGPSSPHLLRQGLPGKSPLATPHFPLPTSSLTRSHSPLFYLLQLRDVLQEKLSTTLPDANILEKTQNQGQRIEISRLLGKTTLDVIGLAGFGYEFDSLHDPENELALALELMLSAGQVRSVWVIKISSLRFAEGELMRLWDML